MAGNPTVLSIGGVSISVSGGYTGNLLKQVSTAYNNGGTATTLAGGQADPSIPAAPGTHPSALVIPTDDSGTILIPPGYDYVLYTGTGTLTGGDASTAIIGTNLTYSGPAGTVIGTGGSENVTDSTAGATMSFSTGDVSLVAQGAGDTIDFDSGLRGTATIGGNNDTVNLGSPLASPSGAASVLGAMTIGVSGASDVINITDGANLVEVASAGEVVNQSGGATTLVTGFGGVVTLNATGGTQTVYDNAGANSIHGGTNTEFTGAVGGAENFFISSAGGADTVFAQTTMDYDGSAAASTLFIGGAGAATVFAGTTASIYGGTAGGSYTQGTGGFLFVGGGGTGSSDTILGGSTAGNATVWGNTNDNITVSQLGAASGGVYIAFGQSDTLNATDARGGNLFTIVDQTVAGGANFAGNTTLVGSNAGHDTFAVSHFSQTSAHTITIENWQASDAFKLAGFSAADQATANSALSAAGGSNATFTLSDNTTIKFMGAAPTSHT